ncbi:MAG: nucleotidyltransferase domain-containing protein [Bacteriovoracaceae bacterium]|jgi:predicted nucleotidyltransferase|nr:nucleotidyltransferase domain-containing protein [Bacteriovoracaceae bacterium]
MNEKFKWLFELAGVEGVLLVGSYARGDQKKDSDIDLVVLVSDLNEYLANTSWTQKLAEVKNIQQEDWGLVQSLRVEYIDGTEVEYGLTTSDWVKLDPIDQGTYNVLRGGHQILFDPNAYFSALGCKFSEATTK